MAKKRTGKNYAQLYWNGVPVPYVTLWSSELHTHLGHDEHAGMESKLAVCNADSRGVGVPMWGRMHYGRQRETVDLDRCQMCNCKHRNNRLFGMDLPWTMVRDSKRHPALREPPMCPDCILRALKNNGSLKRRHEMGLLDIFEISNYVISARIRGREGENHRWRPGNIDAVLAAEDDAVEFMDCILTSYKRLRLAELIRDLEGEGEFPSSWESSLPAPVYEVRPYRDRLDRLLVAKKTTVQITSDLPNGANGQSLGGLIKLRPGLCEEVQFGVLLHETAHEILHGYNFPNDQIPTAAAVGFEVQAEAVSLMVRMRLGLDAGSHSAEYIHRHNSKLKDREIDVLNASLEWIGEASDLILSGMGIR